jgi:exonuclease SbcD
LLYHGELLNLVPGAGAFGDESGDHEYMPVRLSAFDGSGFDYVLAGHFHRGYGVHRYEGGYFIYPGSPVSISRKETGTRHANLIVPGEAPEPVPLETHHISRVDVVLDPFSDVHPLDQVEARLKNLSELAVADVRIRGFVDLSATEYTEMEFAGALQQTLSRYRVKFGETDGWQDVGEVLGHDLFRRFNARIPQVGGEVDAQDRMRRMVIESLMETMHAR